MKIFSDKDLSWGAFAAALVIVFVVVNAFRGPLPGGSLEARIPILVEYLGSFLAATLFALPIVAAIWGVKRFAKQPYVTPKRDLAVAVLLMSLITFRSSDAATIQAPQIAAPSHATHPWHNAPAQ